MTLVKFITVVNVFITLLFSQTNAFAEVRSETTTVKPYLYAQPSDMKPSIKSIQHDPENGTVSLIKGNLFAPIEIINPDQRNKDKTLYQDIAIDFIESYRHLFKLNQPKKELVVIRTQIDNLDYKHIRLQQVYKSIPVWDSELIVHINTDEIVYLAGGHYIPTPDNILLTPSISKKDAFEYALKQVPKLVANCSRCSAKLIIYYDSDTSPRLAYLIEAGSQFSGTYQLILDAHTGKLITQLPRIQTSSQIIRQETPIITSSEVAIKLSE